MASKSLKVLVQEVQAANALFSKLREEETSTCDSARYRELSMPGGLVWKAMQEQKKARERLQKRIHSMTGVYAYAFKEMI